MEKGDLVLIIVIIFILIAIALLTANISSLFPTPAPQTIIPVNAS